MLPLVLRSNEISFLLQGRLCLLLQSVWKAGKCPFVILSILHVWSLVQKAPEIQPWL